MATDLATSTVAYASQAFWAPETGGLPLLDPLRSSCVKLSSGPLNYAICYENWFHRTGSYGFRHGAQPASRLEQCRPLFDAIGRQTFVVGSDPSQANAVKLCGNFMIAAMLEAFGEAYATLRKADVLPHTFLEVMSTLFGSPVYANYGRLIADEKFEPAGFALRLGFKDVRLVLEAAEEFGAPMPLASLLRDNFLSAMAHGQADQDWASVARVAARNAGLE